AIFRSLKNIKVEKSSNELEKFKDAKIEELNQKLNLENLKDVPIFRKYRDFFWDLNIDPTKTRPASEALVRRALKNRDIPSINTLVDAYNIASMESGIPLAAFDADSIEGVMKLRFAEEREEITGIGMDKPIVLDGNELIISDSKKPIAIYPYRDSKETKITLDTKNVILLVCGAPGVKDKLKNAENKMLEYVKRFCDGE
ncbi:MAG: B3/4 domain-containing protein, partial [Candidatus Hadarchaeia archaeon]